MSSSKRYLKFTRLEAIKGSKLPVTIKKEEDWSSVIVERSFIYLHSCVLNTASGYHLVLKLSSSSGKLPGIFQLTSGVVTGTLLYYSILGYWNYKRNSKMTSSPFLPQMHTWTNQTCGGPQEEPPHVNKKCARQVLMCNVLCTPSIVRVPHTVPHYIT